MRRFLSSMVAGSMLVAGSAGAQAAELAWTGLNVRVYDNAGVSKAVMRTALEAAARALMPAEVEMSWVACTNASGGRCTAALGRAELMVRLVRSSNAGGVTDDESLGTALIDPSTGTGVLATVYVDRVERLARGAGGELGALLGRAMAHEIGHLLLGRTAHAAHGLMRPRWTRAEVVRNAVADWRFEAPELQTIRERRERF